MQNSTSSPNSPVVLVAGISSAEVASTAAKIHEILLDCTILQANDCQSVHLQAVYHKPDIIALLACPASIENCRSLQRNPAIADIPIVFLMTNNDPALRLQALDAGASACLSLPLDRVDFLATTRTLVRLKRTLTAERRKDELIASLMAERNEEVERKNQHLAQQERNNRFHRMLLHTLIETTSDAVFLVDSNFCFLLANTAFCKLVGKSVQEIQNKFDVEVLPDEILPFWQEKLRSANETGARVTGSFPFRGRTFEITLFRVAIASGTWGIGGMARDVTAAVLARRELEDALEDWQHTFDAFNAAICLLTPDHRIRRANRLAHELYNVPSPIVKPPHCWEFFHAEKALHPQCPFEKAQGSHHREIMEIPYKNRILRISVDPVYDVYGHMRGAVHVVTDITVEKQEQERMEQLESQLQHAQKMEALGQIAGGIAHDFNHMLSVILAEAETAEKSVSEDHPCRDALQTIKSTALLSSEMAQQLLAFSRRQPIQPSILDVQEHIASLLPVIRKLAGENIQVHLHAGDSSLKVYMDPGQLSRVLLNLAANARDAMNGEGRLELETGRVDGASGEINGVSQGTWVRIRVSDTGCGIPQPVLAHIFEPFFTTKSPGHGTGLGLATVWGIVQQNHGFIQVESSPGAGSTFAVYLPEREEAVFNATDSTSFTPLPETRETLLLVEDDPALLRITARILTDLGYRVLAAQSAAQALQHAQSYADGLRLLITDIAMPEITGIELARQVRGIIPDLPVLLISGYNQEAVDTMLNDASLSSTHFLPKPFTRASLVKKLHEIFAGKTAG